MKPVRFNMIIHSVYFQTLSYNKTSALSIKGFK